MGRSIETIYTRTRRFRLEGANSAAILTQLRRVSPSNNRLANFLFEFNLNKRRVAVISGQPLYTALIYRDRAVLEGPLCDSGALGVPFPDEPGVGLLRVLLKAYCRRLPGLAGIAQGLFTLVSYEAARQFEPKLQKPVRDDLPEICALVPRAGIALEVSTGDCVVAVNSLGKEADESELIELEALLQRGGSRWIPGEPDTGNGVTLRPRARTTETQFQNLVKRAREYIKAGDIFQVVLSVESVFEAPSRPLTLFQRMSQVNPQTANFLFESSHFALVGASPEILSEKQGQDCIIRPLAGTLAHRGVPDLRLERRLLSDEKECAEHRMLVDLARNDLGRVCRFGSVRPERLMEIEYYYKVMHIVSEIRGKIREDRDVLDLLTMSFPAGTMTGAPKIRAMEIIDELEPTPRTFFSGGIGILTPAGDLYSYILIRSLMLRRGLAFLRAGAGIVYNSEPRREYKECLTKLENARRALEGSAVAG